ncbi:CshA/CshB family fibrillar adhesin-related protein [Erythrobacter oryzae]|uniref:CshA/CshB family fibrillar adhesin-related protein n=1 Tax=Erythrobacter oryzae TaxID=3019556 RepID=UPI0025525EC7|nr:CshA/CshB family fibrillar adhesin-related protein [Erythrobacter sp. COR-2]
MISYSGGMFGRVSQFRRLFALLVMLCVLAWSPAARAQDCAQAATQGTAPASWQTYCWLDMTDYDDATARSAAGQNLSFTLPDGSTLTFNARVTGTNPAYNDVTAPSWSGSAVGNSAFIGIPGRPVLYSAQAGTSTIAITGITITPPVGGGVTVYSFVVADAESSNENEYIRMTSNGGPWQLLDSVPPSSGSTMPPITGVGSGTVNITGTGGTVGAYILGSSSPTSVTVETRAGGLQGVMFAIRFASIRLQTQILGTRANSADQLTFQVASTGTGTTLTSGTTTGSGNGPFTGSVLNMSAGVPVTLRLAMAGGSVSPISAYAANLSCVNTAGTTRAALPNNLNTTNTNIGQLEFGEFLVCTFQAGAQPRLRVRKVLGSGNGGGRRFTGDQFTVRIMDDGVVTASSTTTGTGTTITTGTGDTGLVQVVNQNTYQVDEVAAGTTILGNYTAVLSCTNGTSGSPTVLPTTLGGGITLRPGDSVTCTITNTRRAAALLEISKVSTVISDPVNGTTNPKAIPGAVVEYAITVRNVGAGTVDASSIVLLDVMPAEMAFAVGTPVTFTNGTPTSGLNTFNANTMVTYSQATNGVAPYNYTPTGTFDANVRGIRIAPTGTMAAATSATAQPSFTIRFRAQVR